MQSVFFRQKVCSLLLQYLCWRWFVAEGTFAARFPTEQSLFRFATLTGDYCKIVHFAFGGTSVRGSSMAIGTCAYKNEGQVWKWTVYMFTFLKVLIVWYIFKKYFTIDFWNGILNVWSDSSHLQPSSWSIVLMDCVSSYDHLIYHYVYLVDNWNVCVNI